MIEKIATRQRMADFYIKWFNRVYVPTDSGWVVARTPDGQPITQQDAHFWFSLEIIARELNAMRALELAKMTGK
jgi:hypothetical protein